MNRDILFFEKAERLFFTSDTHFGHRNIIKYCQHPFSCIEEMDDALIANRNEGYIELRPANDEYPVFKVDDPDNFEIWDTVIHIIRTFENCL